MDSLTSARSVLHLVAVHVVARARVSASARFSLRPTPGGFGTPDFGPDGRRVRVSGDRLLVESDERGAPSVRTARIDGSSLAELARFAGVDLAQPLDVGHDTPAVGDSASPLALETDAALGIGRVFGLVAAILDAVLGELPPAANPTLPRLWPEHFDVAIEAEARPGVRVNLGGSPGDGYCDEPYLYVGPWTADRPGDATFWNAPFGAARPVREFGADPAGVAAAGAAFLLDGYRRLAEGPSGS